MITLGTVVAAIYVGWLSEEVHIVSEERHPILRPAGVCCLGDLEDWFNILCVRVVL